METSEKKAAMLVTCAWCGKKFTAEFASEREIVYEGKDGIVLLRCPRCKTPQTFETEYFPAYKVEAKPR